MWNQLSILLVVSISMFLSSSPCAGLSSFHQDVAFSFVDTNGPTTFPGNSYDRPPLLDRLGASADFTAQIAGTYVFIFHVATGDPAVMDATDYKLVHVQASSGEEKVLLRLTANGPGFGHTLVDLDVNDKVRLETYNGTSVSSDIPPDTNTTNPLIFNGFNLYHRCLCSPLTLRQSAFTASRTTMVPGGTFTRIGSFVTALDIQKEFDASLGVFTATLPGIYVFIYSFPNLNVPSEVSVSLVVGDADVKSTVTTQSDADRALQYGGTIAVLDLVAGDRVSLVLDGSTIDYPTVTVGSDTIPVSPILFSGYLL